MDCQWVHKLKNNVRIEERRTYWTTDRSEGLIRSRTQCQGGHEVAEVVI